MKIQKKNWGGGWGVGSRGGSGQGGVRVDGNGELKLLRKFKKKIIFFFLGGGVGLRGSGWGGVQGGCEWRSEAFVKIQKKKKKKFGGGGGGGGGWGVRVDVKREVKFCEYSKKKNLRWGGGGVRSGVGVGEVG